MLNLIHEVLTGWNGAEGRCAADGSDCGGKIQTVVQQLRGGSSE